MSTIFKNFFGLSKTIQINPNIQLTHNLNTLNQSKTNPSIHTETDLTEKKGCLYLSKRGSPLSKEKLFNLISSNLNDFVTIAKSFNNSFDKIQSNTFSYATLDTILKENEDAKNEIKRLNPFFKLKLKQLPSGYILNAGLDPQEINIIFSKFQGNLSISTKKTKIFPSLKNIKLSTSILSNKKLKPLNQTPSSLLEGLHQQHLKESLLNKFLENHLKIGTQDELNQLLIHDHLFPPYHSQFKSVVSNYNLGVLARCLSKEIPENQIKAYFDIFIAFKAFKKREDQLNNSIFCDLNALKWTLLTQQKLFEIQKCGLPIDLKKEKGLLHLLSENLKFINDLHKNHKKFPTLLKDFGNLYEKLEFTLLFRQLRREVFSLPQKEFKLLIDQLYKICKKNDLNTQDIKLLQKMKELKQFKEVFNLLYELKSIPEKEYSPTLLKKLSSFRKITQSSPLKSRLADAQQALSVEINKTTDLLSLKKFSLKKIKSQDFEKHIREVYKLNKIKLNQALTLIPKIKLFHAMEKFHNDTENKVTVENSIPYYHSLLIEQINTLTRQENISKEEIIYIKGVIQKLEPLIKKQVTSTFCNMLKVDSLESYKKIHSLLEKKKKNEMILIDNSDDLESDDENKQVTLPIKHLLTLMKITSLEELIKSKSITEEQKKLLKVLINPVQSLEKIIKNQKQVKALSQVLSNLLQFNRTFNKFNLDVLLHLLSNHPGSKKEDEVIEENIINDTSHPKIESKSTPKHTHLVVNGITIKIPHTLFPSLKKSSILIEKYRKNIQVFEKTLEKTAKNPFIKFMNQHKNKYEKYNDFVIGNIAYYLSHTKWKTSALQIKENKNLELEKQLIEVGFKSVFCSLLTILKKELNSKEKVKAFYSALIDYSNNKKETLRPYIEKAIGYHLHETLNEKEPLNDLFFEKINTGQMKIADKIFYFPVTNKKFVTEEHYHKPYDEYKLNQLFFDKKSSKRIDNIQILHDENCKLLNKELFPLEFNY